MNKNILHQNVANYFGTGGLHEENPHGGIPQGQGANGRLNTVEEGEFSYNFDDGKYIFSNRLFANSKVSKGKTNKFSDGGKVEGPVPNGPLAFTKSEMVQNPIGGLTEVKEEFEVPDVRENYIQPAPFTNEGVNFQIAVKDKGAQQFLDRYNNPWARQKLKEQSGITDNDIDNMILRGLSPSKEIDNSLSNKYKAMFDRDSNSLIFRDDTAQDAPVETHERVHSSLFDASQGEALNKALGNPYDQKKAAGLRGGFQGRELLRYLQKKHEAYGNFAEFRERLGHKPGDKITPEELKKKVDKLKLNNENFFRAYDAENIAKALNTIAYYKGNKNQRGLV